jgi:hypothetical protein
MEVDWTYRSKCDVEQSIKGWGERDDRMLRDRLDDAADRRPGAVNPIITTEFEIKTDSAGLGKWRGGIGVQKTSVLLDVEKTVISCICDRERAMVWASMAVCRRCCTSATGATTMHRSSPKAVIPMQLSAAMEMMPGWSITTRKTGFLTSNAA